MPISLFRVLRRFDPLPTLFLSVALAFAVQPCSAASLAAVRGERGMVVSADASATRIGVEVLRRGGNSVDAAVAVALALAVTFPEAGNLGGGGLLLYRDPGGEAYALDFRETAPRGLSSGLFVDGSGKRVPDASLTTGLAVGVPGTVAGLFDAHRRWGSLPWAELVAPAIRLAEEGTPVSGRTASRLKEKAETLTADSGARSVFFPSGAPPVEGERLRQPDLARTLRGIAEQGPPGFYEGPVAERIVRTVRGAGGVMTAEDLAGYRPVLRSPVSGIYRGHRIVCFPPPSGGGVLLLQILGMLEGFDLAGSGFASSRTIHLMAEAERRAFADRSRWLGDPDFVDVPVGRLLDADYLASRAASIRSRRASRSRRIAPGRFPAPESADTTHLSVCDPRGGAVALTTTLNAAFGAGIVAAETGVLLNNEMDDFAIVADSPNLYGLTGGELNSIAGGKRPLSSMTPTIVEAPGTPRRPFLVLGSPGGPAITTAVLQVLVNVIDHRMPLQEAVDAPRFHHQWVPDRIDHEARAFPADVARALEARGHRLHARAYLGNVSAIGLDEQGAWLGAADPRRGGLAAGF